MYIFKRSGEKVSFDGTKIEIAIRKANAEVSEKDRLNSEGISELVDDVYNFVANGSMDSVEEIQDFIVVWLGEWNYHALHDVYSAYREERERIRNSSNTTDNSILDLIGGLNEEVQKENSNKDPVLNSTQRDLIAGEVSKDITRRKKLPRHIVKAHDDGIIHFHDMDYFVQPMYNCCLVNLEDMLQNGTVINGNMIERPKSFQTACTVATQIVAQVASAQYGGQTISLAHLAPFVDVTRQKYRSALLEELEIMELSGLPLFKQDKIVEERVKKEIADGVQTIQYQLETLSSTNGRLAA